MVVLETSLECLAVGLVEMNALPATSSVDSPGESELKEGDGQAAFGRSSLWVSCFGAASAPWIWKADSTTGRPEELTWPFPLPSRALFLGSFREQPGAVSSRVQDQAFSRHRLLLYTVGHCSRDSCHGGWVPTANQTQIAPHSNHSAML